MNFTLPHKIKNHLGDELIFHRIEDDEGEEKLIIESYLAPNSAPVSHTFHLQDEYLIVLHGKLGYQVGEEQTGFAGIGETVFLKRGAPHKIWNAGTEELNCYGWIKPANNVMFYLSSLYQSIDESGTDRPGRFDSAFLLYRYGKEFDIPQFPKIMKSVIFPATYHIGKIAGKYKKFRDAPVPVL